MVQDTPLEKRPSLWPSGIGSRLGTEQVVSLIPGSVGYISHVDWAYDYSGSFGVFWLDTKIVLKKKSTDGRYVHWW